MNMRYDDYLQTDRWKELAALVKDRAERRCVLCNSPEKLVAHHRTYERVGRERMQDLTCLCDPCHQTFHQHRKLWGESMRSEAISQPARYVGMAKAKKAPETALDDAFVITGTTPVSAPSTPKGMIAVSRKNKKRLKMSKETWAYMHKNGIDPRKSGWADRMVGRVVPESFFHAPKHP